MPNNPLFPVPGSVKTLRDYYKEPIGSIDFDKLHEELNNESDRAKIILLSSILDDMLTYRMEHCININLTEKQWEYIFRFEGPMGTFSSKIEIAYVFGCIDIKTAKQLNTMREMRNACAHSKYTLSFDAPELANVAKHLFKPIGVFSPKEDTAQGIRDAFIAEMPILFRTLVTGSREDAIAWARKLADDKGLQFLPEI
jgi:hypothetical protein